MDGQSPKIELFKHTYTRVNYMDLPLPAGLGEYRSV